MLVELDSAPLVPVMVTVPVSAGVVVTVVVVVVVVDELPPPQLVNPTASSSVNATPIMRNLRCRVANQALKASISPANR